MIHDRSAPEEVGERAHSANVLITNKSIISAEGINQSPALKFISVSATGYDCVDVPAATRRGVLVANVPEYGTDSVAQLTFALLLELCHHVGRHADAVRAGEWSSSPDFSFWRVPLVELAGKTMGIVGFGRIGRRVGELAHAFGMGVVSCSLSRSSPADYQPFDWAGLDELFSKADVISLHCPIDGRDSRAGDRSETAAARQARCVPHQHVARRAGSRTTPGRGAGGGPARRCRRWMWFQRSRSHPDNPLLGARNCLITPHIAWATREARRRLLKATVANVAELPGRSGDECGQCTHE